MEGRKQTKSRLQSLENDDWQEANKEPATAP